MTEIRIPILLLLSIFFIRCSSTKQSVQTTDTNIQKSTSFEVMETDADFCLTQEDFDCALYLYNKLLSKFPDSAKYHYKRALVFQEKEEYDQSLKDISRAIELSDSTEYEYYYTRGLIHYKKLELESARDDFFKSTQINKNCGNCYNYLGSVLGLMLEGDQAVIAIKKSIAANSHKLEYRINLAIEYIRQNKYDSSLAVLNDAIELDSTQYLMFFYRAIVFYETENYIQGDVDLIHALKLHKNTIDLCYEQIKQYKLTNGLLIADRMLCKITEVYPQNPELYIERAQINQYLKNNDVAIQMYSNALESEPDNFDWRVERAKLLLQEQQFNFALTDYSELIEQQPEKSEFYIKRGYAHYKLDQISEAKKDWQTALKLGNRKAEEYLDTYINK